MIDLHMHTNCSDGQFAPKETVRLAAAAGVTVMAVTDHDTIVGIPEAKAAAEQLGISFVSGIELSAKWDNELHLLGYGIDCNNEALLAFCQRHSEHRRKRGERLVAYLTAQGAAMTLEEVRQYNNGSASGRPHFARALVEKGYAASVQDAFARYLTTPAYYQTVERKKPEPAVCIQRIHQAGGAAVLAHPHQLRQENEQLDKTVKELKEAGLDGIEAYYSLHTPAQTAFYCQLAKKYDLCITCGSDYHGPAVKPEICLGTGKNNSLCVTDEGIFPGLQMRFHGK